MVASGRIFSLDSIGGVADMLAASAAVLGDYREVDRRLDAIAQVTAGEITVSSRRTCGLSDWWR